MSIYHNINQIFVDLSGSCPEFLHSWCIFPYLWALVAVTKGLDFIDLWEQIRLQTSGDYQSSHIHEQLRDNDRWQPLYFG